MQNVIARNYPCFRTMIRNVIKQLFFPVVVQRRSRAIQAKLIGALGNNDTTLAKNFYHNDNAGSS